MSLSFDVFWSFRSPYSYLATYKLIAIEREYDVAINVRPVYPLAVRTPDFFKRVNPMWMSYVSRDCTRLAEMEGVPFALPSPNPIVQDFETLEIAPEQPYIHRLTRLGVAATEQGRGLAFIAEVSRLIFGGTKDWHEGKHLAHATKTAGLSLSELDAKVNSSVDTYEAKIRKNEADQKASGHWGVPLMVFNGEPFFGQDRIEVLVWRMKSAGLRARANGR
jgi:2-hydroxychromene-2-carboxylate isomerase